LLPVDHDDFAELPASTPQEMAFAAEVPHLAELAKEGTPSLRAEIIALNAVRLVAQQKQDRHAA
jgi:hypothetical protein